MMQPALTLYSGTGTRQERLRGAVSSYINPSHTAMNYLLLLFTLFIAPADSVLFDFNKDADLRNWYIVDDVVMGGESNGRFSIDDDGHGLFEGTISLDNNGGFSSVRHMFPYQQVTDDSNILIRLKGDGKPYQFRVKHDRRAYFSYVITLETTGEWQEITIPLKDMIPMFRGRRLNMPGFDKNRIGQLGILFGNERPESFRLLIDEIRLLN